MSPDNDLQPHALPSKRKLATTTAIAVLVAVALLVTVVLPAEYGIDPIGTGAAMGLASLSAPASPPQEVAAPANGTTLTPVQEGPTAHYAAEYKFDSAQFVIGPYEYVEYKYRLEKGASVLYSWTAGSDLIHDFHGQPDEGPRDYEESFDKRDRRQAHGAFTAPFAGIHGWYWENPGGETVTVKLTTAGFYTAALEVRSDRTRRSHELTALETITVPRKTNATATAP